MAGSIKGIIKKSINPWKILGLVDFLLCYYETNLPESKCLFDDRAPMAFQAVLLPYPGW